MLLSHPAVSSHSVKQCLRKHLPPAAMAEASLYVFSVSIIFFCCCWWVWNLKLHLSNVPSATPSDAFPSFSRSMPSLLPNPAMLSVLPAQPQPAHIPQPLAAALWSQPLTPNPLPWRSEDFTSLLPRPSQGATRSRLSLQENQLPKWLTGVPGNPGAKTALRNRILAWWIWMMQAFQLVMCRDGSVWRMIHLFGPLISSLGLWTKENSRKWEQKNKTTKKKYKPEHCCYIYVCVCSCAHMGIYNVFVCCLSAEGQRWTLGIFSEPDSKSLTREGPNCTV